MSEVPVVSAWAKLRRDCAEGHAWHCRAGCSCPVIGRLSLVGHSADVAATMRALLSVPNIRCRLAALLKRTDLNRDDVDRLTVLAALHDLGKINHGFQRKPFATTGPRAGHVTPLVSLFSSSDMEPIQILRELETRGQLTRAEALLAGPDGDGAPFHAIMAHHGALPRPGPVDPRLWRADACGDPALACSELVAAVASWCPAAFDARPIGWTAPFGHAFAGLLTLADWLGSDTDRFPFPGQDGAPDGPARFAWALERASETIRRLNLEPSATRTLAQSICWSAATLTGYPQPTPPQADILGLPPPPSSGRICIVEGETGSGKTEAALIHFLDLFRQGLVDGMYFALPTRAAAKQIHARLSGDLHRLLGDAAPPVGLAVPGYLGSADSAPLGDPGALWPDEPKEVQKDATWATERSKRYLAGWVMVGTVDQVLMGGLQVRHAHLRSGAMLRLLLVVDEVHASDVYMSTILRSLLAQHRRAGGHALLMSATLGSAARVALLRPEGRVPPPAYIQACEAPYPATWTDGGAVRPVRAGEPPSARQKVVHVGLEISWQSPDAIVDTAVDAATRGARVLVIRNTVRLALATQMALETRDIRFSLGIAESHGDGVVHAPHHARFAPEDRRRLDEALEGLLGKRADRSGGRIAICTQTAEQSLDIDADLLITDLCPADVLLQRIGRLHRHHGRARPEGFEMPRVIVVAPPEEDLAVALDTRGEVRNPPLALGLVYANLLGVLATRRALAAGEPLSVPKDNRGLVEASTHPEALKGLAEDMGGRWLAHWGRVRGIEGAHALEAHRVCLDWKRPIEPFPDIPQRISTRLGLDDRTVELPAGTIGPFGGPVTALNVPGRWLPGVVADAPTTVRVAAPGVLGVTVGDRSFLYDRLGLRPAP